MNLEVTEAAESDADLATRIVAGGELARAAEGELCRRLLPRVRVVLGRHLRDIHAVDDAAQEVLMATLVALRSGAVKDPAHVGAFALGVCRNKAREQWRRGAARRAALEKLPAPEPVPAHSSPVRLGRLEECLTLLRERQRSVLRSVFCEGRTSRETGEALGLTPENVRVLQHRAIAQLRACVSKRRFEVEA